jgi:hypothetical protein
MNKVVECCTTLVYIVRVSLLGVQGFTLEIKMNDLEADTTPLTDYVKSKCPTAYVFQTHQGYVNMQVQRLEPRLRTITIIITTTTIAK